MIKNIIFDFDGVILDSMDVKTESFRKLFETFSQEKIDKFIEFHMENGGMSRYKKIEYFFNILLNKNISEDIVIKYAKKYSKITKQELSKKSYLIKDTVNFIKNNYKKYNFHIASGADENDLKYICENLDLEKYFLSINGSPKIKDEIIRYILERNNYEKNETILIGDSVNDLESAKINGIEFYGYNNSRLNKNSKYIDTFLCFSVV